MPYLATTMLEAKRPNFLGLSEQNCCKWKILGFSSCFIGKVGNTHCFGFESIYFLGTTVKSKRKIFKKVAQKLLHHCSQSAIEKLTNDAEMHSGGKKSVTPQAPAKWANLFPELQ